MLYLINNGQDRKRDGEHYNDFSFQQRIDWCLSWQRVGRLVKGLYLCIVCVCEVGEVGEVGGGSLFLQRARRLVKGLYFSTDVPILWFG